MAWKDVGSDGVPKLDLSHPRVQAAMRVTGIQERDLTGPPPPLRSPMRTGALTARAAICDGPGDKDKTASSAGGANSARAESLARSKDLWERKQRQLWRELESTADALDDEDVEALLKSTHTYGSELDTDYQRQKAQVERMRERLMDQLKREAKRQIDRATAQAAADTEREAEATRAVEKQKERREALAAEADKRAAQMVKVQERVRESMRAVVQRRRDITAKLESDDQRLAKLAEDKLNEEKAKGQELRSRIATIAERKMASEQAELEQKVKRYEEALRHDLVVEERLTQAREERRRLAEERQTTFQEKLEKVSTVQEQEARERERRFKERAGKVDENGKTSAERRAKSVQDVIDGIQARRDKELTKLATNQQLLKQQRREKVKQLRHTFTETLSQKLANRDHYYDDLVLTRMANRGLLQDVVDSNKARRARSDDCARRQAVAKIEREIAKTNAAIAHREQLQAQRVAAIREALLGRMQVDELRHIDPGASESSKKRMNAILKQLDMPPLPTGPAKEGEEGQQQ